jgi:uncharacterized phage-associated protein
MTAMHTLTEKTEVIVHTLLYILKNVGGSCDFHKIFKILYFADQKHLAKYGSSISQDRYIAMTNGPVPSEAYDIFKALNGEGFLVNMKKSFTPYFELLDSHIVRGIVDPDLELLSDSEVDMLNESIKENGRLSFNKLTEKSHDSAWHKANRDSIIEIQNIAKAGGASRDTIRYINDFLENSFEEFE